MTLDRERPFNSFANVGEIETLAQLRASMAGEDFEGVDGDQRGALYEAGMLLAETVGNRCHGGIEAFVDEDALSVLLDNENMTQRLVIELSRSTGKYRVIQVLHKGAHQTGWMHRPYDLRAYVDWLFRPTHA